MRRINKMQSFGVWCDHWHLEQFPVPALPRSACIIFGPLQVPPFPFPSPTSVIPCQKDPRTPSATSPVHNGVPHLAHQPALVLPPVVAPRCEPEVTCYITPKLGKCEHCQNLACRGSLLFVASRRAGVFGDSRHDTARQIEVHTGKGKNGLLAIAWDHDISLTGT
jgi:hypothetical protein